MGDDWVGLGEILKSVRVRRGLSARQLSAAIGASESYIHKIESGDMNLSLRKFARIAEELELNNLEVRVILQNEARV